MSVTGIQEPMPPLLRNRRDKADEPASRIEHDERPVRGQTELGLLDGRGHNTVRGHLDIALEASKQGLTCARHMSRRHFRWPHWLTSRHLLMVVADHWPVCRRIERD